MRKLLIWLVIAFAAFWIVTSPKGAAAFLGGAFSLVGDAFASAIVFFGALFG